jgi:putative copper resistance protein D
VLRTVSWLLGLALLIYVTCGAPAMYGRVLFSAHMVMHMLLTMGVPPLLVLGAPVTLALRVLPARGDGSRGAREWILGALNSRLLQFLAFPPVAAVLFAGSLIAFYFSDLFKLALTTHVGHELMDVHFLLTGYLFAWVLIGIDPGPRRLGYPLRLLLLFITMAFHAFFFLSVMGANTVLQAEFFGELGRNWGRGLLADQQYGGGIGWGIGEVPTLLIAMVLVSQWIKSDERDARRYDRAADRDGDAELEAYNAMLAKLANRRP